MEKINYLAGDFETIRHELTEKLKSLPSWKDQTESSVGQTLIRLYSYIGDLLLYRMNFLTNENYIDTIQIKENMLKIVKMLNYKPKKATASYGKIQLYSKNNIINNIIIPKGTKFSTDDGITFYSIYEKEMVSSEKTIDIDVIQGVEKEEIFKSNNTKNQEFFINTNNKNYYIGNDIILSNNTKYSSINVYINNKKWNEVNSFINTESSDEVFTIESISDYSIKIIFGDGEFGKIPQGDIKITYNLNIGKFGNINKNKITKILNNIKDIRNNSINLLIKHENAFLNGGDPENIESIRVNAPKYFKSGDRAITHEDIKSLISSKYSNIIDIFVYGEEDKNTPNFKLFNQIVIGVLLLDTNGHPLIPLPDGSNYNDFYKNLDDFIKTKKSITVWRKYIIPEAVNIYFKIKYKRFEGYNDSEIVVKIQKAIDDYLLENGRLNVLLKFSDILYRIETIEGIDYCFLELKRENQQEFSVGNIQLSDTEFPILDINNITIIKE